MQVLQKESRSKPQEIKVGYQFVEVTSNIKEVEITENTANTTSSYKLYRYTLTRYTHQEWTTKLQEENKNLKEEIETLNTHLDVANDKQELLKSCIMEMAQIVYS